MSISLPKGRPVFRSKSSLSLVCVSVALLGVGQAAAHAQELRRSGSFGVQVVAVPDAIRNDLQLPNDAGVLVQALVEGGSAKSAGIETNDVITDVGEHR